MRRLIIRLLNSLIAKKDHNWVFMSNPDFSDNSRALYEFLRANYQEVSGTWIVADSARCEELNRMGIKAVKKNSIVGLWTFMKAKAVITSHMNLYSIRSRLQVFVNLWHGVALKAIGYMDKDTVRAQLASLNDDNCITISTSRTVSTVFGGCFHVNINHLYITGQPRNDDLFSPISDSELSLLLDCDVSKYAKIVFYMPTFRQGYLERTEGKNLEGANIFRFEKFNLKSFQEYLIQQNILFICKLHPYEEKLYKDALGDLRKSIVLLSSEDLFKHNVDLYNVLGKADLLVTDYSSVFFDYLLLNKPMVFTPTDLEEYEKKRGFLLEPYDFWTPGPKATNQKQLQDEILKSLEDPDYYRKERETINNIINHYKDDRSCERVTQLIMEKLNRKE